MPGRLSIANRLAKKETSPTPLLKGRACFFRCSPRTFSALNSWELMMLCYFFKSYRAFAASCASFKVANPPTLLARVPVSSSTSDP